MINANKEKIQSFFQGDLQYEIPFFQRAYVWKEENWEIFWDHLQTELESYKNNIKSEHFIGTIITKRKEERRLGDNVVELIDGQQRLTTISLLLKAISDTSDGELEGLKNNINSLLYRTDNANNKYLRIIPCRLDKDNYEMIMNSPATLNNKQESQIILAYKYFVEKIKNYSDGERDILYNILLNRLPVISMLLDSNDDEQEIFDTINSLGVRLTIGELLKNYIFKEESLKDLYGDYWQKVFELDEEQVKFWLTERTSGRVKRDNMELLLYCFLIIETRKEVRLENLLKEYKSYLNNKTTEEKKAILKRLKDMAETYFLWPQKNDINEIAFQEEEKRFFHVLENLEITTIFPLVLYLYKRIENDSERLKAFKILESYVTLRLICKLSTKNYNNLFIQIIRALDKIQEVTVNDIKAILKNYDDDTNRIPSKHEIIGAFKNSKLSNKQANEILFIIALKDIDTNFNDIKKLSANSYSVEHMMPKKWEENWNSVQLDDLQRYHRNQKLLTLGNLTLITRNLNSKLKNDAWENKKKTLKEYSSLKITTDYLSFDEWNENRIEQRAEDLAQKAIDIWKI